VILVDSSGWIEFFTGGSQAARYAPYLTEPSQVITPTVVVYEVYKIIKRERTEEEALLAVAQIQKTQLVHLTATIALDAADLSLEHGLAMADSIVYATAKTHQAELVTSDSDLRGLPGVTYVPKRRR
jgi:predicted nucleic acid-binding protein